MTPTLHSMQEDKVMTFISKGGGRPIQQTADGEWVKLRGTNALWVDYR